MAASFAAFFGGLWLLIEPVSLIFPDLLERSWGFLVLLLAVSACGAVWRSRPRDRLEFILPPSDVTIAIAVGDVLAQEGNIVIGSNDTFDSSLTDEIISVHSVQGQLLKKNFNGNTKELDDGITTSLVELEPTDDPIKSFGKTKRYPIGTVAIIKKEAARYFLPAIATMSASTPPRTTATVEGVQMALTKAWEVVGQAGQREPVHAPIIGSHLARLGLSRTWLVQMMVLSFVAVTKKESGSDSLTIWVAENDAAIVDMAALDDWLRALCAA